ATPEAARQEGEPPMLAWIEGLDFSNGTIEAEVAGAPASGAFAGARGFVGIAFRLQIESEPEGKATYDAFYLRPTNGRAEDQERRNHATQYISYPDWTWSRLRQETPSKYESYVDLEADRWTKIRIEVRGERARLYVHDQQQPALIVHDVKSGANRKGAVALWAGGIRAARFSPSRCGRRSAPSSRPSRRCSPGATADGICPAKEKRCLRLGSTSADVSSTPSACTLISVAC